jgi:hypothetical protein
LEGQDHVLRAGRLETAFVSEGIGGVPLVDLNQTDDDPFQKQQ